MNTTNLLRAAAVAFAIATTTGAIAQTTPQAAVTTAATSATTSGATASAANSKASTGTNAAGNAVAGSAIAAGKAQQPTGLTRAQVQAEFLEARKNGTLLQTEADFDVAQTRKHVAQ